MSYNPVTDFLGLLRQDGGSVELARMPGLDFVVAALARAGVIRLSTGSTEPTTNQSTTVWFHASNPSWTAEGVVFLWNSLTATYETATPALWAELLTAAVSGYNFQSATVASTAVVSITSLVAVQRIAPSASALRLPTVLSRNSKPLQIVDWSTGIIAHTITLTPAPSETIMRLATWQLFSTVDQLAGITLYPATDLNGWVIAP